MSRTKPDAVVRATSPYSIEPGLLAWVQENCRSGGPFGFPGHAFELGLYRLKARFEFARNACRRESRTFKPAAFWAVHQDLLLQAAPGKRGVRTAGEAPAIVRERIHATVSEEILKWAAGIVGQPGGPSTMSQAIEVGLLLLRQADEARVQDERERLDVELQNLWQSYRDA
jgi:hypothetical protein